jgi:hypothetical protein
VPACTDTYLIFLTHRKMENAQAITMNQASKNIILTYKGNLTDDLFHNLIQLAELKLERIETDNKLKKKVFGVVVEVLQNIFHHFENQFIHGNFFNITFTIKKIKSGYLILTGNPILKNKIKKLQESIDSINNMTSSELNLMYKKVLGDQMFSPKGGAGLGLLYLVRKSGTKVDYTFQAFNNDYSFFNLKVKVSA